MFFPRHLRVLIGNMNNNWNIVNKWMICEVNWFSRLTRYSDQIFRPGRSWKTSSSRSDKRDANDPDVSRSHPIGTVRKLLRITVNLGDGSLACLASFESCDLEDWLEDLSYISIQDAGSEIRRGKMVLRNCFDCITLGFQIEWALLTMDDGFEGQTTANLDCWIKLC